MDGKSIRNLMWMIKILTFVVATGYEKDTILEDRHLTSFFGLASFLPHIVAVYPTVHGDSLHPRSLTSMSLSVFACCLY